MTSKSIITAFLVEAIPDVAACSAVIPDCATEVGGFFGAGRSSPFTLTSEEFGTFSIITSVTQTR